MNKTHLYLWLFGMFGVLISCGGGIAEDIDPRLKKILDDWQKRQNAFSSVRYEVRGEHHVPKGAYNVFNRPIFGRTPRNGQDAPPQDYVGPVSLSILLDFEKGRHRSQLRVPQHNRDSGKFSPLVKEDSFDGSVAKGAMPRDQNANIGSKQPEFYVVSGNMKYGEFRTDFYPIFFGHGRIYTVFEPILPGKMRNKPDPDYLYVHGTGVQDGRTCLIVRTQTLRSGTTSFDEYWVDTERESAILRYFSYSGGKPTRDITIHYGKLSPGWLPERWRYQVFGGGGVFYSDNLHVERVDLAPAINESDFEMEINPGMIVEERTDLPTKHPLATPESEILRYRFKEGGGREELPVPPYRKGKQYQELLQFKGPWFWPSMALPVLAIVVFLVWKRRRVRMH